MAEAKQLTNTILKGIMTDAICDRGYCTDFDSCKTPGYYVCSVERTVNFPPGAYHYGILTVKASGSFVSQEYHAHQTKGAPTISAIYIRMGHTKLGWTEWMHLSAVAAV